MVDWLVDPVLHTAFIDLESTGFKDHFSYFIQVVILQYYSLERFYSMNWSFMIFYTNEVDFIQRNGGCRVFPLEPCASQANLVPHIIDWVGFNIPPPSTLADMWDPHVTKNRTTQNNTYWRACLITFTRKETNIQINISSYKSRKHYHKINPWQPST